MKRRMGEKDSPDDNASTASDSDNSDEDPPNTAVDNNDGNQAGTRAQIQTESSPPRSSSRPVNRSGGRRTDLSNPRRAKRARAGDSIEQAMMESCKEMAQCYKQLVSAVVKQSERDSSRTLETSEESRLIMQAQEEKLAEQSVKVEKLDEQGRRMDKKLDQQAQRMDLVLGLLQGLYQSNSATLVELFSILIFLCNQEIIIYLFITHYLSALTRLRS